MGIGLTGGSCWRGTSMAAPHVCGVIDLLKAQDSRRDWRALRNLVLTGVDRLASLRNDFASGGRLNAFNSLTCDGRWIQERVLPRTDLPRCDFARRRIPMKRKRGGQ